MGGPGSGRRPAPCGTTAKYQWHRKRGEDCGECRAAMREKSRQRYKPKGRKRNGAERKAKARELVLAAKLARGACLECRREISIENVFAFDLDHRDPVEKSFTISAKYSHVSLAELQAEIDKCDLLCAFCHRLRTYRDWHHLLQIAAKRGGRLSHHPTLFEEIRYD